MTKLKCIKQVHGLTVGKVYDAVVSNHYDFTDDDGNECYHSRFALAGYFEVVEEDTIKREGVVALLPEGSEFKIGQRLQVDRSGYFGYTTIKGYNYYINEYATECDEDNGCSHDCEGLAKEEGKGLWVSESDIIEAVEAKQPKWSEWIENTTGKCPEGLKRKQKVKLKWCDGDEFVINNPHDAAWYFSEDASNITHYKVKLKEESKWTKNTGVNPLNTDACVKIVRRDSGKVVMKARYCDWSLSGHSYDIIKWRLAD